MLWAIFVILLVLWLLGLVTTYTMGGLVHILLILADCCSDHQALSRPKSCLIEVTNMKPISWIGILLIVLGALALAYQGISYTREKKSSTWDRCTSPQKLTNEFPFLQ